MNLVSKLKIFWALLLLALARAQFAAFQTKVVRTHAVSTLQAKAEGSFLVGQRSSAVGRAAMDSLPKSLNPNKRLKEELLLLLSVFFFFFFDSHNFVHLCNRNS